MPSPTINESKAQEQRSKALGWLRVAYEASVAHPTSDGLADLAAQATARAGKYLDEHFKE